MQLGTFRGTAPLAAIALILGSVTLAPSPVHAADPTCFGRAATIIGVAGEDIIGTDGDDVIVGTSGPDHIEGRGGDDIICSADDAALGTDGGGGPDWIDGGDGADQISGSYGDDIIIGGDGDDDINAVAGDDLILGGRGDDTIWTGLGADTVYGEDGDDRIDLEIASGTTIQVARQVVVRRLDAAEGSETEPENAPENDTSPASPAEEE